MESDLIDFIRSYREPVAISVAAGELAMLGKAGGDWPRASSVEWAMRLNELVVKGLLRSDDGMLTVARGGSSQGTLFDL